MSYSIGYMDRFHGFKPANTVRVSVNQGLRMSLPMDVLSFAKIRVDAVKIPKLGGSLC